MIVRSAITLRNEDNSQKSKIGRTVKLDLAEKLKDLKLKGHIKNITEKYALADPSIKGKEQFMFDFKIDFHDNSSWIIHCTNSIRTDRIKGNYFDAEHLKRLNPFIESAFIVYPDNQSSEDLRSAQRVAESIKNNEIYSPIDDVISFRGIVFLIEAKSINLSGKSSGYGYAIKGLDLETLLVQILNNSANRDLWNTQDKHLIGNSFDWFYTLLNKFGYTEETLIKKIHATKDIPKLPSGGYPKSDISVTITTENDEKVYNLSCKRVTKSFVSIHQYSSENFVKVLQIKEDSLKLALKKFQENGGKVKLKENDLSSYDILNSLIKMYNPQLIDWAFFGIGGEGSGIQIADYLVSWNESTNSFSVLSKDQVLQKQLLHDGQFGTPFMWTYASKSKGKSIQLKGKV